jgi:hypothetical protein
MSAFCLRAGVKHSIAIGHAITFAIEFPSRAQMLGSIEENWPLGRWTGGEFCNSSRPNFQNRFCELGRSVLIRSSAGKKGTPTSYPTRHFWKFRRVRKKSHEYYRERIIRGYAPTHPGLFGQLSHHRARGHRQQAGGPKRRAKDGRKLGGMNFGMLAERRSGASDQMQCWRAAGCLPSMPARQGYASEPPTRQPTAQLRWVAGREPELMVKLQRSLA